MTSRHKSPSPHWTKPEKKPKAEKPYVHGKDVAVYPKPEAKRGEAA